MLGPSVAGKKPLKDNTNDVLPTEVNMAMKAIEDTNVKGTVLDMCACHAQEIIGAGSAMSDDSWLCYLRDRNPPQQPMLYQDAHHNRSATTKPCTCDAC
jgi:hypothetical protein